MPPLVAVVVVLLLLSLLQIGHLLLLLASALALELAFELAMAMAMALELAPPPPPPVSCQFVEPASVAAWRQMGALLGRRRRHKSWAAARGAISRAKCQLSGDKKVCRQRPEMAAL